MTEQLALYLFVVLALAGGVMAAGMRHILNAIIGLAISLLGVAGLFLHLGSPFVAGMQILIYIGGIVVAIVFAMMLSLAMTMRPPPANRLKVWFAGLCATLFLVSVSLVLSTAQFHVVETPPAAPSWAIEHIGHALLTHYNLVFEALSVVLLLAIIGAILIARQEKPTT
jgi:NADH:ubiquinone oxidoreductase subunit 6 (subunit J)